MQISDFPFPPSTPTYPHHEVVGQYLRDLTEHFQLTRYIQFNSTVTHVNKVADSYEVTVQRQGSEASERFDAVVVCSGHFHTPFYPSISGLTPSPIEQIQSLPALPSSLPLVLHSFHYRTSASFTALRVLVIGSSFSGTDIAGELCTTARSVTLSSRKSEDDDAVYDRVISRLNEAGKTTVLNHNNYRRVGQVTRVIDGGVEVLHKGRVERLDVDVILCATGYHYTFPFLSSSFGLSTDDMHVTPLYAHLFHPDTNGRLVFPALQWFIVPFPMTEIQCEWMARVMKGECNLPTSQQQREKVKEEMDSKRRRGLTGRYFERCDSMVQYVRWIIDQLKPSDTLYPYRYSIDEARRLRTHPAPVVSCTPPLPSSFRDPAFLHDHIDRCLSFYVGDASAPRCVDPRGGFFQCFRDDGSVYDRDMRHIVSSTRFVILFAWAFQLRRSPVYLSLVHHGLKFMLSHHHTKYEGWRWTLRMDGSEEDATNFSYAFAFVVLMYATVMQIGVDVKEQLTEVCRVWEERMWEEEAGLYKDEATEDWSVTSPYRGQNSNMHACEAHLVAYHSTSSLAHLHRAQHIADVVCRRQSLRALTLTGINAPYEHWTTDWLHPDLDYNRSKPNDVFKPWGFQPGHLVEWARLLLMLEEVDGGERWYVERSMELFDEAMKRGWDVERGGVVYSFNPYPPHHSCDWDKYKWVNAESMATAARLGQRTGEEKYWVWYDRLWEYSWRVLIDHDQGGWWRLVDRDGNKYDDLKSPPGKVDYHSVGACRDVLMVLGKPKRSVHNDNTAIT